MSRGFMELAATRLRAIANAVGLSPLAAMRLSALVALDLAALAFAILAMFGDDERAQAPKSEWRPPRALAPATEREAAGDDGEALSRPIFWRSRRPIAGSGSRRKIDRSAQNQATANGFSVAGIVKIGQETRVFLVSPGVPDGRWLTKGENLEGWTVEEITDLDVALSDGGQFATLKLYGNSPEQNGDASDQDGDAPEQGGDAPERNGGAAAQPSDEAEKPAPEVAPDAN